MRFCMSGVSEAVKPDKFNKQLRSNIQMPSRRVPSCWLNLWIDFRTPRASRCRNGVLPCRWPAWPGTFHSSRHAKTVAAQQVNFGGSARTRETGRGRPGCRDPAEAVRAAYVYYVAASLFGKDPTTILLSWADPNLRNWALGFYRGSR